MFCLWMFIVEYRFYVVEFIWFLYFWGEEFIFYIGMDNWCSFFWMEGDMMVIFIIKVIYFFSYDICCIFDRVIDNFVMFKNGCVYFCVVVVFENFMGKVFNILLFGRFSR